MLLGIVALAHSQVMQLDHVDYYVQAKTQVGDQSDDKLDNNTSTLTSFSKSLSSYTSISDPTNGDSYASAGASAGWNMSAPSSTMTLTGFGGGVAEAWYNGYDTYALAVGTVTVFFDVLIGANAMLNSEGTYNSDLYVLNGSDYVPFYTGLNGTDNVFMPAGSYKMVSGAGSEATGGSYYSAGVNFTIEAEAVPEPASLFALSAGAGLLLKRSRRKA